MGLLWAGLFCTLSVFKCGLFSNMVCYESGLLWTVLLWTWSVMNWSVMKVLCSQMWSVMNVVCYECDLLWTGLLWMGLLWTCSVMKAACYEHGLLWTGLLWTWSVTNVVCYEPVCYEQVCNERGLFWVVCCEWSVMNRSVLKRNRGEWFILLWESVCKKSWKKYAKQRWRQDATLFDASAKWKSFRHGATKLDSYLHVLVERYKDGK